MSKDPLDSHLASGSMRILGLHVCPLVCAIVFSITNLPECRQPISTSADTFLHVLQKLTGNRVKPLSSTIAPHEICSDSEFQRFQNTSNDKLQIYFC